MVDDPTLSDGLGPRPFYAEATAAQRTALVERGLFRSFLHSNATARRTGQRNTGHAERGCASTLGVGVSNPAPEPGSGTGLADGLVVTDAVGVHAGANPITGDVPPQGLGLHGEGGEARSVEDFKVSFNLFTLLERVGGVGDAPEWRPTCSMEAIGVSHERVAELSSGGA